MNILIDNKSGAPIYDQIYSQIKSQIISGVLREDDMLPSIRGLAKDLRISFITTKRAYEELEKDGFIYTLPGKGCYVAPKNVELLREENLKKINDPNFPAINVYWDKGGADDPEHVSFVEYNPERGDGHEVCIGVYNSVEEDTIHYGPYMAERK